MSQKQTLPQTDGEPQSPQRQYKDFPALEGLVEQVLQVTRKNPFALRTKVAVLFERGDRAGAGEVVYCEQVLEELAAVDEVRRYYYKWLGEQLAK